MLQFNNHFTSHLPADEQTANFRRQVLNAAFSYVEALKPSRPELLHYSTEMAESLGLTPEEMHSEPMLSILTGGAKGSNSKPYAMAYGGHQFGHWAGQLGDGRAINLGEIKGVDQNWTLQLKGAGPTPYSRSADGLAVLRSSIREHLCSEAMYHLGVPTTRSLSLALTGDQVLRDVMYDGHPAYEKGAVVCRVAPSFIRFGNFQLFAARKDEKLLRRFTDYTIDQFFSITSKGKERYLEFLNQVMQSTIDMIVHWQRVGFVHGVMNTDNMSIHGLTIDYGPYGWLEDYDPEWTPNTTDRQDRRYRFGNQPYIGLWNVVQLANALFPLVGESQPFEDILKTYNSRFADQYMRMMHDKLGIKDVRKEGIHLVNETERLLKLSETDMTIFFRLLGEIEVERNSLEESLTQLMPSFYQSEALTEDVKDQWIQYLADYKQLMNEQGLSFESRKKQMQEKNPKYVLRNYMAQLAIDKADEGDYELIDEFYNLLKRPYEDQPEYERWFAKRPDWARHKIGCSMLSCSS
jgi:uncharacterized protein YdiU (UPF0061 family)